MATTTPSHPDSRRLRAAVLAILLGHALSASACSTATAAGCGGGILAGVALGLVSLAGVSGGDSGGTSGGQAADTGSLAAPVVLGSALFGVVCGCTGAAVSGAIARAEERRKRRLGYVEMSAVSAPAPGPSSSSHSRISGHAELDGLTLFWARPSGDDEQTIQLTLQRVALPGRAACDELEVQLGQRSLRFAATYATVDQAALSFERGKATLDFATVNALSVEQPATIRWCGMARQFTVGAQRATRNFLARLGTNPKSQP